MKNGMKSKNLDDEKEISSALKDVIDGVVMTGSGSENKDIVEGAITAVNIKTDAES
jgi:hypothetical protein